MHVNATEELESGKFNRERYDTDLQILWNSYFGWVAIDPETGSAHTEQLLVEVFRRQTIGRKIVTYSVSESVWLQRG